MRSSVIAIATVLLAPATALAEDPAPASVPPAMDTAPPTTDAPAASGPSIAVNANGSMYYLYNMNADPSIVGPTLRAYDTTANSFTTEYAEVNLQYNNGPVSFRMDIGTGQTAHLLNYYGSNASTLGSSTSGAQTASTTYALGSFVLQQAFGTIRFNDMISLDAGHFVTSASDEVIETYLNWNYSRSLLFNGNGVPLTHTGLRANIAINEMMSLQVSLVNGTNNDPDNNGNKMIGAQVGIKANEKTQLYATTYIGKGGPQGAEGDTQILLDLIAALSLSDTLAVSINADYFKQGDANWLGVGGKAKLALSDPMFLALRGEFIKSKSGFYAGVGGPDVSLYEVTGTLGYKFGANIEARAEVRIDMASEDIFFDSDGPTGSQITALLGMVAHTD